MSSLLDNVRFDVVKAQRNESLLTNVVQDTVVASGIGHLISIAPGKEGDYQGVHERERGSVFRLTARLSKALDETMTVGMFIRVKAVRSPETRGWLTLATVDQYRIDFENAAFANSRDVILNLSKVGL